jgi:hypothetical protein
VLFGKFLLVIWHNTLFLLQVSLQYMAVLNFVYGYNHYLSQYERVFVLNRIVWTKKGQLTCQMLLDWSNQGGEVAYA